MSNSVFCCPLCGAPLRLVGTALRCPKNHTFDLAKEGYANLLPVQRKRTQTPGDSAEMVAARRAFLHTGAYAPFAEKLAQIVKTECEGKALPLVVDAGCGEGYYTAHIAAAVPAARIAAFDIAKTAVRAAAKQSLPCMEWAVASSFAIPLAKQCADVLVDVFSPVATQEFARVLRPGGALILAVPGPRHLFGLKELLYETPYENKSHDTPYPGFVLESRTPVQAQIAVEGAQILNLFTMTPYYWKTPPSGMETLRTTTRLETEIHFDFLVYRRAK